MDVFVLQRWAVISKTQMKNAKKAFNREQMKSDAKDKKEVCVCVFTSYSMNCCPVNIQWSFSLWTVSC